MKDEIENLIIKDPACDFEHIWNCAIFKAIEVIDSSSKDYSNEEEDLDALVEIHHTEVEGEKIDVEQGDEVTVDWPFEEDKDVIPTKEVDSELPAND